MNTTPTTNIWRSKNLLRLGIASATADFVWEWEGDGLDAIYLKYHYNKDNGRKRLPAWSLSALLQLMPTTITVNGKEYRHILRKWFDPELEEPRYEFNYESYYDGGSPRGATCDDFDPINAAYDLVCWLAENNLLNR